MRSARKYLHIITVASGLFAASGQPFAAQSMPMDSGGDMPMMSGMEISDIPRVPPVAGYAEGVRIFFIHTEVSDPRIGTVMSDMMGSPVPVVPSLAAATDEMLGKLWAFTNGVQPEGPRGPLDFQPDIFDRPPGSGNYSPLRMLYLVSWSADAEPRLLTSAAEIESALAAGEVSQERTGIVVNAPFLTWPGGQR